MDTTNDTLLLSQNQGPIISREQWLRSPLIDAPPEKTHSSLGVEFRAYRTSDSYYILSDAIDYQWVVEQANWRMHTNSNGKLYCMHRPYADDGERITVTLSQEIFKRSNGLLGRKSYRLIFRNRDGLDHRRCNVVLGDHRNDPQSDFDPILEDQFLKAKSIADDVFFYKPPFGPIITNCGKKAICSPEDFDFLLQFNWGIQYGYARRNHYRNDRIGNGIRCMHKMVAYRMGMATPKGLTIDHINQNKLDNRRENLRTATQSQNNVNRTMARKGEYRGVGRQHRKWRASIRYQGKTYHSKLFHSPEEAFEEWKRMAKEFYGEFIPEEFK